MSLKRLPKIAAKAPNGLQWDTPVEAVEKFNPLCVCAKSDNTSISMYGEIGENWDGTGITANRISAALRSIGEKDITVSLNSPGGDFFEGIAIYNLLREHPHKVTVKIISLAASAASVIAMAGDEVEISKYGSFMIHDAWAFVVGNRLDMVEAAELLESFDASMVNLYADATGVSTKEITAMMDKDKGNGTWFSGEQAVEKGFATSLLPADEIAESDKLDGKAAIRKVDMLLAKQGLPRSERKSLMQEIKSMPGAAQNVMPGADMELFAALSESANILKSII